jgi:hypothetical protein
VFAVRASGVAARNQEEGRSLVNHHTPDVRIPSYIRAIFDVQP